MAETQEPTVPAPEIPAPETADDTAPTSVPDSAPVLPMQQMSLAIGPDPALDFESFVVGSNAAAVAHLSVLQPGSVPVYLWGGPGVGKTHLLLATAQRWRQRGDGAAVFDAGTALPWRLADERLIVLDDCERYGPERQRAAFSLFIEAAGNARVVLAAGRLPPIDLPLRDDLRTRLAWGPVFALQPLDEAQTRAALRNEAERRGLRLPDELTDYLLNRFSRDLKHLHGMLDDLDAYAMRQRRALSVPLLRQMLAEAGR